MASVYPPQRVIFFFFFFFFFLLLCQLLLPCSATLNPKLHNANATSPGTLSFPTSSSSSSASSSGSGLAEGAGHYQDGRLAHFVEETCWYNDLVLGPLLPHRLRSAIPRPLQSWLRSYIAGLLVYFGSASLWCLYIYGLKSHVYFPAGADTMPSKEAVLLQIWVSMKAMPIYVMLPVFSEYMVERGWSKCYSSIHEVGLFRHVISTFLYLALVEFGIYWVHRLLHDCKALYKWLHATHHIYNKENTLSPFAGLAFHPLDGLAQALPHAIFIYLVPTQLFTHELLLFVEGIWTTNIHDCLHGKVWPIMGAGYHTIHHSTYRHNYGHYTIWMDWMFGTLLDPCEPKKSKSL